MSVPKSFAITHTWPDLKNAEYEVLQRLLGAADRIGARAIVVDRNGRVLWAHAELDVVVGDLLAADAVEFLMSMHFESGRVLDCYSYVTLWQPIDFYHTFGYQRSIDKVTSYNDLISCASDLADGHGLNLMAGLGRTPLLPLPRMFHTLPEPFLEPQTSPSSSLFYIGINWERLGRATGRFHEVLTALDQQGMTEIYGPEQVNGVAPWEGYGTYRGELPFDGTSVKAAINRAGICLVLSSASHKRAGIMSNRLFEGIAGGGAIVATPNAIIDKYFAGVAYIVDDTRGDDVLRQQIVAAVREIRADPDEARRRTLEGQRILREHCSLETSLQALFDGTKRRRAHFEKQFLARTRVSVILTFEGQDLDSLTAHLQQFQRQRRARVVVHLVCDERFAHRHQADIQGAARDSLEALVVHPISLNPATAAFDGPLPTRDRTGPAIARALNQVDTPLFAFSTIDDEVFGDHFASAAKVLEQQPGAMLAATGSILESTTADCKVAREFHSARFVDHASIVLVQGSGEAGRFVFRRELLQGPAAHLLPILDGEEHSYFRLAGVLAGPLAQTNYPSYLQRQPARAHLRPVEPIDHQRQYIRDLFARDPRWITAAGTGSKLPEVIEGFTPGTPIRWADYQLPPGVTERLAPGRAYATRAGGEGLRFLASGFSSPEPQHIWIDSERAVIEFTVAAADPFHIEDFALVIVASGKRSLATGRNQHVTLTVNGMVTGYALVPDPAAEIRFPIPNHLLRGVHTFRIELTPDHSDIVVNAEGEVVDPRRLSVCMQSLRVERTLQRGPPLLASDHQHGCAAGQTGVEALNENFYPPEDNLAWIAGRRGTVWFRLATVPPSPQMRLRLYAHAMADTGVPPTVEVAVNGTSLGEHALEAGHNDIITRPRPAGPVGAEHPDDDQPEPCRGGVRQRRAHRQPAARLRARQLRRVRRPAASPMILVTGSGGVLGRALGDALAQGTEPYRLLTRADVDLTDHDVTAALFRHVRPRLVFHLAGRVHGLMGNSRYPADMYVENTRINTAVVEAARIAGCAKIVAASTVAVYQSHGTRPVSEDMIWDGPPHPSEAAYAHAKRAMLAHLEAVQAQHGLVFAYPILTNLYGPHDRFDEANGHVVPSLISKFHGAANGQGPVKVWGTGAAERDFMASADAARALLLIGEAHQGPINVATGQTVRIRELVEILQRHTGTREVEWDATKPDGQMLRQYDISRLRALGFKPLIPLADGIAQTYDWFAGARGARR